MLRYAPTKPAPKVPVAIARTITRAVEDGAGPTEKERELLKRTGHGKFADALDKLAATKRGRPASGKRLLTLRLSDDVIDKFRATGKGWQARIDEALRKATP